jgi:serine/threonine protein kinase
MSDPKALVGEVLDRRYRLVRFLGAGAFGWVYAAEELVGGEAIGTCALKVLRPKTPEQGRSVLREFAAAARLAHPGLVQFRGAFDVQGGAYEGALCLAMELGEGTLRDDLRAGRRLAPEEAMRVARDLAEVLAWLHAQGAVHRDVKPENLLRIGKRWKLGDLGLVRAVEGTLEQTVTPRGTPRYLAPEAMKSLVGPSVDVWGLGVVVQESLTGVLAYDATSEVALYGALLTEEPTIAQNLPAPFDAVVRGCLVKDPRSRWTAHQVLQALAGWRLAVSDGSDPVVLDLGSATSEADEFGEQRMEVHGEWGGDQESWTPPVELDMAHADLFDGVRSELQAASFEVLEDLDAEFFGNPDFCVMLIQEAVKRRRTIQEESSLPEDGRTTLEDLDRLLARAQAELRCRLRAVSEDELDGLADRHWRDLDYGVPLEEVDRSLVGKPPANYREERA